MNAALERWLFDPLVGKLVATALGLIFIVVAVRLIRRALGRAIRMPTHGIVRARSRPSPATRWPSSVAGLLAVSWGGFYRTDDRVQLGGITGDVIDIGVLRTTLMETGGWVNGDLYNGRVVRIANGMRSACPSSTAATGGRRAPSWNASRRKSRRISPRAAAQWQVVLRQYRLEDAGVQPLVTLMANDNWLEFTVRYVVDYKRRRTTKDRLFTRILEEFDATSGSVGIASATFHLVEAPTFDVRLLSAAVRAGAAASPGTGPRPAPTQGDQS